MRWLQRVRAMGVSTLVVLAIALSLFGVVNRAQSPKTALIAGTDFTITSAIKASPGCTGATVSLYPGVVRCLVYTVSNPLSDPITVDSLTLAMDPGFAQPAGCPSSNLDLTQTSFSGSLVVPANGTATVNRSIALIDAGNQNACKLATFHFRYSGHATYIHVYGTSTALASSANASWVAQQVTFTATVTAVGSPPSGPTGAIAFKDGASLIACEAGSAAFNGTTATCKYTINAAGTRSVTAVFTNVDGNFAGSTSGAVSQVVHLRPTTSALTSSLNPSTYNTSVTFTDTVTSSAGGIPSGTVTFKDGATTLGASSLDATGKATLATAALLPGTHSISATYAGSGTYATSTSNTVAQVISFTSCITGTQNGGFTVNAGQAICVPNTGKLNGGVTVKSGGLLYLTGGSVNNGVSVESGGSLSMVGGSVNGGVTSTGAKAITVCGGSINGGISASTSIGFVLIGDGGDDGSPACAPNQINNGVTLTGNTAGVEVGGNAIKGGVTLTNNTGSPPPPRNPRPEVEGNTINGGLACTGNSPAPTNDGQPNTVSGSRTGQCAAL